MAGGGGRPRRARSAGEARAGAAAAPPRRRSERKAASPAAQPVSPGKPRSGASRARGSPRPAPFAMRPITLKKIVPRGRQAKETTVTPRRSPRISKEDKENIPARATESKSPSAGDAGTKLEPVPLHCPSLEPAAGDFRGGTTVLSPVSVNRCEPAPDDQRDLAMAKRVRRSYSRLEISLAHSFLESSRSPGYSLADTSTPDRGPGKRHTLFGFEKLLLSDEVAGVSPVNANAPLKVAETAGEPDALQEPDTNIPGIAFCREKRRKKKVPQFDKSELDQWAAQMNAEFAEAERFNLLVE
ncbi:sororin [Tiliqua scincoides]|uniref:sororin n=1 Tax=Tiliqua scincoides TaxID=71010 RepID=UPI003462AA29